ncbi:hypothetical protein PF008_g15383 [Phytophthora fragariae]|uniref:Myb/SANT-like domain-containing protein n=1 Tax=Phytophthora fragariae TaxID=53985 RepID=A0A6G0REE7_9STRA|nr:hypothetical protein PF008_g15383 [Phytophthora fragariae]
MTSAKPRGRPPGDGNFIVWTEALTASLLRLRFGKYAEPMAAARGTKALRLAWAEMATEITQQNGGNVVTVEQCRNKLKAMKNKWLAYHAGLASEPVCLALMNSCWESEKDTMAGDKSPRQSRPGPEQRKPAKRARLALTSSASSGEAKTDVKPLTLIAPAPAPTLAAATLATTSAPISIALAATSALSSPSPTATVATQSGTPASFAAPAQLQDLSMQAISQGFTDIASAIVEAARTNDLAYSGALSTLEKLIDDRFAKVLETQEKQLRLTETQNQLLAQLLSTLRRNQHG